MYEKDGQKRTLTTIETTLLFIAGLLFNAIGNGFTVATNMGSAPWTASAANLALASHLSITEILLAYGLLAAIATLIVLKRFDWRRLLGNMLFVILFSIIIGKVTEIFVQFGLMTAPIWLRILIDFVAITSVGIGVSITQRLQLVLHPLDDLVVVTRFKYFHGDAKISQLVNFSFPMIISLGVWLSTGQLVALNIGTLFSFFFQGYIIQSADRYVFPHLIHKHASF
ncbi:hypothetical protein ESZ50_07330 [Weissella muntiaci]|uniref:Integral membrane protein n=1 Tax=Weissella muntiaci TaxID=2508881 RepID=A0A6C2C4Y4_9LACO|nr:hypothetical protein [Weissella muntiaci]TYC49050.1 hypothetical protein ESZ50_07330 [Weissella muntiaci]